MDRDYLIAEEAINPITVLRAILRRRDTPKNWQGIETAEMADDECTEIEPTLIRWE